MEDNIPDSSSPTPFDIASHLPLRLIKSEVIPPAPNRPESVHEPTIDWLHDFAGYTWIAYGAASLLVISHFPNPLSESETLIGPIFRQVFELSVDGTGTVSAVAWSPVTPSTGDVAAVLDCCIGLFSYISENSSNSSFCWSQSAILLESTKVESIQWTISGDGIIAGGVEVVLWKNKQKSWERVWKFKPSVPQILISASWSIEGILATAPLCKLQVDDLTSQKTKASNCVLVSCGDELSKIGQAELCHPLPITMIQWRPSTGKPAKLARTPVRAVLLTGCLDGTVRFWSECDDRKTRKAPKDSDDLKLERLSFRVVAIIEVNQATDGILGSDVFVRWGAEINCKVTSSKACFSSNDYPHGRTGSCEWLIGFGPQCTLTLWAIHCLDDFSPLRFPRITLWKRQELTDSCVGKGGIALGKVFIARNEVFTPPITCSVAVLLPCSSLAWLHLYCPKSPDKLKDSLDSSNSGNSLSSYSSSTLNIDSVRGNIVQVVAHPYFLDIDFAASLDSSGIILFWSLSRASNSIAGLPTFSPSCQTLGKYFLSESSTAYTSLAWIPNMVNENRILLMGHSAGIDCLFIKVLECEGGKVVCHLACTILFGFEDFHEGPTSVHSVLLPSKSDKLLSNNFMLIAVWENNFKALSWEITIHQCDSQENCSLCCKEIKNTSGKKLSIFGNEFGGKKHHIYVDPCSSTFPADNEEKVTCFAVVNLTDGIVTEHQERGRAAEICSSHSAYHLVTGSYNGVVKLWRSQPVNLPSLNSQWELVGVLGVLQCPILKISSLSGRKIATVSETDSLNNSKTLHVWEFINLGKASSFILEDTVCVGAEVVCLNWLMMGNGQSILVVCLHNKLKIFARRRFGGQAFLKPKETREGNVWACVGESETYPAIRDFFWGPKATLGIVHDGYFCLFSNHLIVQNESRTNDSFVCKIRSQENLGVICTDSGTFDLKEPSGKENEKQPYFPIPMNTCLEDCPLVIDVDSFRQTYDWSGKIGLWNISEVAEMLGGSLPAFHPEALLWNMSAGNWKHAFVALQHLVEHLASCRISGKCHFSGNCSYAFPRVPLSNYLEEVPSSSSRDNTFRWNAGDDVNASVSYSQGASQFASIWGQVSSNKASSSYSTKSLSMDFNEAISKLHSSGGIASCEKAQIVAIAEVLKEVSDPYTVSSFRSLDEAGQRFWVGVKFQLQYFAQRFGRLPLKGKGELVASSELIGWAFHSDCQENLFNSLLSDEPSWPEMRDMGVGFWYSKPMELRSKMEKLARRQYLNRRDPKDCALLYIALSRLQVLAGLFKMSKDEKDKPLVGFLSRNFQDEKNKAAALKNAYVLMGKHQLELAVAFFLLGGDTASAVTVCSKNLGDEQLALVLCRLLEGNGGQSEHNLISKSILPLAISSGDYWLASMVEWVLGNYFQAFVRMFNSPRASIGEPLHIACQAFFLNPTIGQYCLMLTSKTRMKNAVGEEHAAIFSRWAILMSYIALSRCGLPIEAMECLSSVSYNVGVPNQGPELNDVLELFPYGASSNWISPDVASLVDSHAKSDLAMQYMSTLLREHPCWLDINIAHCGATKILKSENQEYLILVEKFQKELAATLVYLQQNYSLVPLHLIKKVMLFFCYNGLTFIGYHIFWDYVTKFLSDEKGCGVESFIAVLPKLLMKASEEVTLTLSRYIISSCISLSQGKACCSTRMRTIGRPAYWLGTWEVYQHCLIWSSWSLRASFKLFCNSFAEDMSSVNFAILDLFIYFAYFAFAWTQRNFERLSLIFGPLLVRCTEGNSLSEIICHPSEILSVIRNLLGDGLLLTGVGESVLSSRQTRQEQSLNLESEVERLLIIGFSLWGQISWFMKKLLSLPEIAKHSCFSRSSTAWESHFKLLNATCAHLSAYCIEQFASYLLQKEDTEITTFALELEDDQATRSQMYSGSRFDHDVLEKEKEQSPSELLLLRCTNLKFIIQGFLKESTDLLKHIPQNTSRGWIDVYLNVLRDWEATEGATEEYRFGSSPRVVSPVTHHSPQDRLLQTALRDTKKVLAFNGSKEIYRRNGELLEALCINAVDQHQAAIATNRKGIIFFNWEEGVPRVDRSEYIWSEVEWPRNGWAGTESTPIPTCVSPGVGLGSRKGTHLGLGGATVGANHLERPGKDLLTGRAFGPTGYAATGLYSLGWGVEEDFEQYVDPPPTLESVKTSAFSAHPSKPIFLVGSSNTHIYLWEFGKDRATAIYGVLPAANVPPPYALASVSTVQFDHCGQRFVTAALDGTVCTWQLEVGGRNNIHPTESSVCFDNYTMDVTYVGASGSIIAAAGYSSSGINVVIWDTLAPSPTSRATIMCHEGGAESLSVFDNNVGSGSISPLIVTGGKGGDVGLHDFRYIVTGRTKKHKHSDASDPLSNTPLTVDMRNKTGDQNRNGMLWYIPKAHSGSVTKITTIPNTSFFLTGGKDGDVKLWDAKMARLVYHWPKLHERHTFLQPSPRGFGGVVRAGVTDIQIVCNGFLTCGGDGYVKLTKLEDLPQT